MVLFGEQMLWRCMTGFSVNGAADGDTTFNEVCQDNGRVTEEHKCKPVDWCKNHDCGEGNKCVARKLSYVCQCKKGQKQAVNKDGQKTCVEIDECQTKGGEGKCKPGKCLDLTNGYECDCPEGYEKIKIEARSGATRGRC